ncbi:hypothetical protein [Flexivirga oryzae]|uniref:Glycosyl hydrolase family 43 n=1 Tax=Flexivirga oryzae TaxID=1794944 RepID=A0A839NG25_9MICO|nr:hypothetical protein [Flexivirga oryzae]MBB2893422.1 hypothetical protein [Flexivirga oryzae]
MRNRPAPGDVRSTATGNWRKLHVGTAPKARGPWKVSKKRLLTTRPKWMSTNKKASVWAPSLIRGDNGKFVVYYSGVVKGTKGRRCIGSATGNSATHAFHPDSRPIACWKGSGTSPKDKIKSEGAGFSLIDPTPARIGNTTVLTYKTQFRAHGKWHTTIRMVKLNSASPNHVVANPVHANGQSIRLTNSWSKYIEENPVLVKHGKRYTLFTSFGWFGRCNYVTRYRQNTSLWTGWKHKKAANLKFPANTNTCGRGNAQVMRGTKSGTWRIFFNGHPDGPEPGHGPKGLYVGSVAWHHGRPSVTAIL